MRNVTNQLTAIGSPISNEEIVQQVLGSLALEYQIFHIIIQLMPMLPTFEDLKAKLILYEVSLMQDLAQETARSMMMTNVSTMVQPAGQACGYENMTCHGLLPTPIQIG